MRIVLIIMINVRIFMTIVVDNSTIGKWKEKQEKYKIRAIKSR